MMSCIDVMALKYKVLQTLSTLFLLLVLAVALRGFLGTDFSPGSEVFALYILAVSAYAGSLIASAIHLPPLLGMLLIGLLFRNCSLIPYYKDISTKWSSTIKDFALAAILLKAGLGIDPKKLKKLKCGILSLSLVPCLCETAALTIFSRSLLGLPWLWSLMLGFILSAVSAAVLVPGMLDLDTKRLGTSKGITTLMLASVSLDNTLALTGFFTVFGVLTSNDFVIDALVKRVLEPFIGFILGGAFGLLMWWFPVKDISSALLLCERLSFLCLGGLSFIFSSKRLDMASVGALGCLTLALVASVEWRKEISAYKSLTAFIGILWTILEIFLFSLIGTQVTWRSLLNNSGYGTVTLLLGVSIRFLATFLVLISTKMNFKENIFVSACWISKATVQAAVGSKALELMTIEGKTKEIEYGEQILSMTVLSILLTAPAGALFIDHLGPYLLRDDAENDEERRSLVRVVVTDHSSSQSTLTPTKAFNTTL